MKNRCEAPIGVFDSGVGGLTVVREILAIRPEFLTEANPRRR